VTYLPHFCIARIGIVISKGIRTARQARRERNVCVHRACLGEKVKLHRPWRGIPLRHEGTTNGQRRAVDQKVVTLNASKQVVIQDDITEG
jgi:hypothetical protein